MRVARLTISFDHGLCRNKAEDVIEADNDGEAQFKASQVHDKGSKTRDGKIIRGLGTHFKSEEDFLLSQERGREAAKIRKAFKNKFVVSPLEGVYFMPKAGEGHRFIETMIIRDDIEVRVTEYNLTSAAEMEAAELRDWSERIRRQFSAISLGRKKAEVSEEGLSQILSLTDCPVLSPKTADTIRDLVQMIRAEKIDKVQLKRRFKEMDFEISGEALSPRKVGA